MDVRKTKSGWVVEITNRVHGMLEQGGICGKEVLYKRGTLKRCGIDYESDPESPINEHGTTAVDWLLNRVEPDRVLKAGHIIQ